MNFNTIFNDLSFLGNSEKSHKMSAYMKHKFSFLGVPAPERREVQKFHFKEDKIKNTDWDFVQKCWDSSYRELQYVAMDYLRKKSLCPKDMHRLKKLIITHSWWDSVDNLVPIVGKIIQNYPELCPLMLEWSVADNLWLRRVAILHQLLRKHQTDTQLLGQIIQNNFGDTEFFINKAIGWALRDYAKTNPQWVRDFLNDHQHKMARLSIREASKYL